VPASRRLPGARGAVACSFDSVTCRPWRRIRLGIPLRSTIRSVVLVSAQARITRPKQTFDGLETVIKADQLRTRINRDLDALGVGETLLKATKMARLRHTPVDINEERLSWRRRRRRPASWAR
jgi:hypothetical protein